MAAMGGNPACPLWSAQIMFPAVHSTTCGCHCARMAVIAVTKTIVQKRTYAAQGTVARRAPHFGISGGHRFLI